MPIFDQGYQHWKGPLSGHAWRWLAVARHGVRTQMKSRIVRLFLLLAWLPAIALAGSLAMWGLLEQRVASIMRIFSFLPPDMIAQPQDFRPAVWTIAFSFFFKAELICSLFLVLVVGPNLISRDLRFNALPLYFSRPLRRIDYFLGKLGVIAFFLAATMIVPALGAYALGLVFSLDLNVIRDTYRLVGGILLYGLVLIVSAGTLMLALSALSRRTIYVGITWVGIWFLTSLVTSIIIGVRTDTTRREIVNERSAQWVKEHPAPPGVEFYRPGMFPRFKNSEVTLPPHYRLKKLTPEEEEQREWFLEWQDARTRTYDEAEIASAEEQRGDWLPICSYPANLERIGEMALGVEDAWVALGRAIPRPQPMRGPMFGSPRSQPPPPPVNERLLADRMVWLFPWYWSAAVLSGLTLLSVWVLTRQVKSLDRLK